MSVNNQDRNQDTCELCHKRRPQKFSRFCEKCLTECQIEVKALMGFLPSVTSHRDYSRSDKHNG